MDYGIIISLIIFSNCAFITLLFTRFDINVYTDHIPTKTVIIRPDDKPFMNSSIRKAIPKRNRIHYRAKSTNNPDHWSQYRHLRNDVTDLAILHHLSGGILLSIN
jgi:hypothetical protein